MSKTNPVSCIVNLLRHQGAAIADIREGKGLVDYLFGSHLTILLCTIAFGAAMGVYAGGFQILINALKMPVLFFLTIYISLPVFYIVSVISGYRIGASQLLLLVMTGYAVTAIVMVAFTPVLLFFIITAKDYTFTVLLTTGISGLSGYFGVVYIFKNFQLFSSDKSWYPSVIVGILVIALVGTQLAWTLRPYFNSYDGIIKPIEGNFYVAMASTIANNPIIALPVLGVFVVVAFLMFLYYINRAEKHGWGAPSIPPPTPWNTYPYYTAPPPAQEKVAKNEEKKGAETDKLEAKPLQGVKE